MVTGEYTEMEWKLRELTNSDPWGCSLADMQSFIDQLQTKADREEVLNALGRRIIEGASWRNRYKSLNLLDHILKHAPEAFLALITDESGFWLPILFDLKENYQFLDEKGKDEGINVRVKASSIIELLQDPELLQIKRREEQEKRELLLKRRQEFQKQMDSSSLMPNIRKADDPLSPRVSDRNPVEPKTAFGVLVDEPDNIHSNDFDTDEFDEFQSAETSPVAKETKDPFESLVKL